MQTSSKAAACLAAAAAGLMVRAEIGLDEPVALPGNTPPAIVVPDPTRAIPSGTNAGPDAPIGITNPPPRSPMAVLRVPREDPAAEESVRICRIVPLPAGPGLRDEKLTLQNRETFRGRLVDVDGDIVRWIHPLGLDTLEFRRGAVLQADLLPPEAPAVAGTGEDTDTALVRLTNGDQWVGRLRSVTPEALCLEVPRVGLVTIRRAYAQDLVLSPPGARLLYHGPRRHGEWACRRREGLEAAPLEDGRLTAARMDAAAAFLDVGLPDRMRVEIDCLWQQGTTLTLFFFAAASQLEDKQQVVLDGPIVGYRLFIGHGMVQLQRMTADRNFGFGVDHYERADIRELEESKGGRITLLASRPERKVAVWLNDRLVKEWKDLEGLEAAGAGVALSGGRIMSRVTVREWDGQTTDPLPAEPDRDTVLLANFDRLAGRVQRLDDHIVTLETAAGETRVPRERVQQIRFATRALETARLRAGDARMLLEGGSLVTLALERLDREGATGLNDGVGRLTVPRSVLQQVSPRIYE